MFRKVVYVILLNQSINWFICMAAKSWIETRIQLGYALTTDTCSSVTSFAVQE